MKFKDFVTVTKNKANNQVSFHLKLRELKKKGLTYEEILDWPKPTAKFFRGIPK